MSLYRITPLVWDRCFGVLYQLYFTRTAFGSYTISRFKESEDANEWGPWRWTFPLTGSHILQISDCKNSADGKRKAEAHWREQLLSCLEVAE